MAAASHSARRSTGGGTSGSGSAWDTALRSRGAATNAAATAAILQLRASAFTLMNGTFRLGWLSDHSHSIAPWQDDAPFRRSPAVAADRRHHGRMADFVAAIDQGTTSTRCMIFDHDG